MELVSVGLVCADIGARPVDDYPDPGKLGLVDHIELHLGGLAGVTATVFCQLGGEAAFAGKVGHDGFGDVLVGQMAANGVNIDHVGRSLNQGTAATIVLITSEGERSFLHQLGAAAELTENDLDLDYLCSARAVHWGGPAVTPGLDGKPIGRVMEKVHEAGVVTSVDTCYDGSGTWLPRLEHALPHLDIVMSSLEEARMYTGMRKVEDIAGFYLSHGPKIALIKLGEQGLFVMSGDEQYELRAYPVVPVDTTGAGDAACAGFLFGYLRGWKLKRCAELANAVGALTVQSMGGAEAITSLEDVEAFMEAG